MIHLLMEKASRIGRSRDEQTKEDLEACTSSKSVDVHVLTLELILTLFA